MAIALLNPYNLTRLYTRTAMKTIEIIYQNQDIIVLNKPSGLSVTKDRTGSPQLFDLLNRRFEAVSKIRLVHRLDKETSGVLLLAKNKQAQAKNRYQY